MFSKISEQVAKKLPTNDLSAQIVNVLLNSNGGNYIDEVNSINSTIVSSLTSIIGLKLEDDTYDRVIANAKMTPIEKYIALQELVASKTDFE
jgi:hypothetical protein